MAECRDSQTSRFEFLFLSVLTKFPTEGDPPSGLRAYRIFATALQPYGRQV